MKSAKRRAAEALLAARMGGAGTAAASTAATLAPLLAAPHSQHPLQHQLHPLRLLHSSSAAELHSSEDHTATAHLSDGSECPSSPASSPTLRATDSSPHQPSHQLHHNHNQQQQKLQLQAHVRSTLSGVAHPLAELLPPRTAAAAPAAAAGPGSRPVPRDREPLWPRIGGSGSNGSAPAAATAGGAASAGSAQQQQQHKRPRTEGPQAASPSESRATRVAAASAEALSTAAAALAPPASAAPHPPPSAPVSTPAPATAGRPAAAGGAGAAAGAVTVTVVPACDPARGCHGPGKAADKGRFCDFEVQLPALNWQAVFDEPPGSLQRQVLARGYEKVVLPGGLAGYLVENARFAEDAVAKLRAGMKDRVVAIDLEWRPETVAGRSSPVALLQLSSATTCLLLRTCSTGYALPQPVADFLADPSLVVLGFGWDGADEKKMQDTFGFGRARFKRFLDLQEVATRLGYQGYGLSRLTAAVLGTPLHKSKSVSRSNWAAPHLTNHQLKYACLDVLAAGQLLRALRLWHTSPSPCAACRQPVGELLSASVLACGEAGCTVTSPDLPRHLQHCVSTGHAPRYGTCGSCQRVRELAAGGR